VDLFFLARTWAGTPQIREPHKCTELVWADPDDLPGDALDFIGAAITGARRESNRVLGHPEVIATADRLGYTPAQVALAWLLALAPNTLLIPGTASLAHLEENLGAGSTRLDDQALTTLDAISP
jgi:hypothetical protein